MPLTYGNMGPLNQMQPFRTANWVYWAQQGDDGRRQKEEEDRAKTAEDEKKKQDEEKRLTEMREVTAKLEDARKALVEARLQDASARNVAGGTAAGMQPAPGPRPASGDQ